MCAQRDCPTLKETPWVTMSSRIRRQTAMLCWCQHTPLKSLKPGSIFKFQLKDRLTDLLLSTSMQHNFAGTRCRSKRPQRQMHRIASLSIFTHPDVQPQPQTGQRKPFPPVGWRLRKLKLGACGNGQSSAQQSIRGKKRQHQAAKPRAWRLWHSANQ
jgi:hypothetical protein